MLVDIFLFLVGVFLHIVSGLFSLLSWPIPAAFQTAVSEWLGYLGYLQGIFPIVPDASMSGLAHSIGLLTIVGYGLQVIALWYTIRILLFVLALIPGIGKHLDLPTAYRVEKMEQDRL